MIFLGLPAQKSRSQVEEYLWDIRLGCPGQTGGWSRSISLPNQPAVIQSQSECPTDKTQISPLDHPRVGVVDATVKAGLWKSRGQNTDAMTPPIAPAIPTLYDRDLALWYADTLAKLKAGELHGLDLNHLIEEIESLAARDRRELKNRLKVFLAHLLKRIYVSAPEYDRGWENTIDEQREQLQDILSQSPSLHAYFDSVFNEVWQRALKQVRNDYPQVNFPNQWPFSQEPETLLTQPFWLNGPGGCL